MLSLSVEIETTLKGGSFVLKLDRCPDDVSDVNRRFYPETISVDPKGNVVCRVDGNELIVKHLSNDELLGDVLLCHPNKGHAQRQIELVTLYFIHCTASHLNRMQNFILSTLRLIS